jgi:hypothetical protein
MDTIRSFVQRVLAAAHTPLAVHGVALEWRVKIELSAALLEAAGPLETAHPGPRLLGQVMERAAAQVDEQEAVASPKSA